MVQQWLRGRAATKAPSHVRVMLVNLSSILTAAVEDGLIVQNPCSARSVKAPKIARPPVTPWTTGAGLGRRR